MFDKHDNQPGSEGRKPHIISHVVKWTTIVIVFALVLGVLVQLLWNWLMPDLFGLGKINTAQGMGLIVLSRILIGGMGQRREHSGYITGKYGFRSPAWLGRGEKEDSSKGAIDR
jgi:hypothetical protein